MTSRKKRPSPDEVKDLLMETGFNSTMNDEQLPASDPVTPVQLVLKLNEIKAYDHNPRREINPVYDEIKVSIREQGGLNNPFNVTRRPDETHYMVQSGGNTRLAILNELYYETDDEVFNTVHCLFIPWQSESSVLCAHLIENEMRGDMTLIDKAYANRELKNQLENDLNTTFSRSEFCKRVKTTGYSISRRHLIRFEYALELDQLIPNILRKGLGANRIDIIKNTEKAYRQFCQNKTDQFPPLFAHILSTYDQDDWDFVAVRRDLDKKLAPYLNMTYQRLRLEVDALLFKQITPDTVTNAEEPRQAAQNQSETNSEVSPVSERSLSESNASNLETETATGSPHIISETTSKTVSPDENDKRSGTGSDKPLEEEVASDEYISPELKAVSHLSESNDLKTLYSRSYSLAKGIANRIDMEHLVLPIKQGLGFIIEKPDQAFTAHDTWGLWWLLMGISEQSVTEERMRLWKDTALYQLYTCNYSEQIQQLVGPAPSLPMYPHEVLQNTDLINDKVFNDIFRLMETCRIIRHHFSNTQLWPVLES